MFVGVGFELGLDVFVDGGVGGYGVVKFGLSMVCSCW